MARRSFTLPYTYAIKNLYDACKTTPSGEHRSRPSPEYRGPIAPTTTYHGCSYIPLR